MSKTPEYIAKHIRRVLKDGASAPHTAEVERFFKEEIKSRGWYTDELRKVAVRFRRTIAAENGVTFLLQVADRLFHGNILEEKIFAVLMLEKLVPGFGKKEFLLFESWLDRVSTWSDHDSLAHYLLGPLIANDDSLLRYPPRWAKQPSRWHQRAAAVSLIASTRRHQNFASIQQIAELLLASEDDMVQKGVGWMLRETAKYNPCATVPYLMTIRDRSPRLVLRTACETLPADTRAKVLGAVTTATHKRKVSAAR